MASEKILIEYEVEINELKTQMAAVQKILKDTEKVAEESAEGTTEALKGTTTATKSLVAQYKELKKQQQLATDPKEFQRLSQEVGKLKDQIEDAADAAKVFASESKFEQVGNALGSIGSKLRNLDFKGAADQSKLLLSVIQSFSFKDVVQGAKDLGTTLFNVGKALFGNPLFLLAAALAAIAYVAYDVTKSFMAINKQTLSVTEALEKGKEAIKQYADRFVEAQIRIKLAMGQITQAQADSQREALKNQKEFRDKNKEHIEAILKLAAELGIRASALDEKGNATRSTKRGLSYALEINVLKRFQSEKLKLDEQFEKEKTLIEQNQTAERIARLKEQTNASIEKGKVANDKIKKLREDANAENVKDAVKAAEDAKKAQEKIDAEAKLLRDLQIQLIADERKREKLALTAKLEDDKILYKGNYELLEQLKENYRQELINIDKKYDAKEKEYNDRSIAESKEAVKKKGDAILAASKAVLKTGFDAQEESDKKELKGIEDFEKEKLQLIKEGIQTALALADAYSQITANQTAAQVENVNKAADKEKEILEQKFESGVITRKEYDEETARIDAERRKKETELRRQQFEREKAISLIRIAINTAEGISAALVGDSYTAALRVAFIAATGAAQAAVVASQPTPQFGKGGVVGGMLHSQGGTLIEAEKDEWVIKRNESIKNHDLLKAVNIGKGEKYIQENYVIPAINEMYKDANNKKQTSFADNLAQSILLNSKEFKDGNIINELQKSRRTEKDNAVMIARAIKQTKINPRSIV